MVRKFITIVVLGLAVLLVSDSVSSSSSVSANNERGRRLYLQYCASCHGVDGKGHGPVTRDLSKPLPDLTQIEKKEGQFPASRIKLVIAGEVGETEIRAHGTKDMPVWGKVFKYVRGDKGIARLDLYALTMYIESIQQK
jgi:mono/diheme cytochrome c family protein